MVATKVSVPGINEKEKYRPVVITGFRVPFFHRLSFSPLLSHSDSCNVKYLWLFFNETIWMSYIFSLVQFFLGSFLFAPWFFLYLAIFVIRFVCVFSFFHLCNLLLLSNSWFVAVHGRTDRFQHTKSLPSQSNFRSFSLNFCMDHAQNAIFHAKFHVNGVILQKAKCTKLHMNAQNKWMPKKWTEKMEFLPSNTKSEQFSWTWMLLTFRPSASDIFFPVAVLPMNLHFAWLLLLLIFAPNIRLKMRNKRIISAKSTWISCFYETKCAFIRERGSKIHRMSSVGRHI